MSANYSQDSTMGILSLSSHTFRPAFNQLKELADDAFQVSARTRSLYREIGKVYRRLGTPDEKPGDLDRIRRQTEDLNRALHAAALYRTLYQRPAV